MIIWSKTCESVFELWHWNEQKLLIFIMQCKYLHRRITFASISYTLAQFGIRAFSAGRSNRLLHAEINHFIILQTILDYTNKYIQLSNKHIYKNILLAIRIFPKHLY